MDAKWIHTLRASLVLGVLSCVSFPHTASAVLPPDILFSVGTSLWQIFAMVGVFVAGAVMSVVPFLKGLVSGGSNWRVVSLCIGLALLSVIGVVTFLGNTTPTSVTLPVPTTLTGTTTTSGFRFFSDRFVMHGSHRDGTPLLVDLVINRKEISAGVFTHYYMAQIIDGAATTKDYVTKDATTSAVLSDLFFETFTRSHTLAEPSREFHTFTFTMLDTVYAFTSGPMEGDFVVRNVPEYTEFSSAGNGEVLVRGERIPVSTFHEVVYSTDYRPLIFFEGADTLRSETIQLVLWDELGNFYLIDRSQVPHPVPAYTSHFWALNKDTLGYAKKAFAGEALMHRDGDTITFLSTVPDFASAQVAVRLKAKYKDDLDKGYVEGQITDSAGIRNISGQGYFNIYGE